MAVCCYKKCPLLIILELIVGGSLQGYLQQNQNKISRKEKILNMWIAKGLQYLHEKIIASIVISHREIFFILQGFLISVCRVLVMGTK
ncbi:Protein tyrosine kinase family protein [Acanthocheilonema viteae]